ncbi:MAG: helix-turn-helix domain-containing protein [Pseudonocardiales bacterium]
MTIVDRWTGREAKLLRGALRLSIRAFAEYLGVGMRTVNKWEARQADITLRPYMQQVLDTALTQASDEAQARFAAVLSTAEELSDKIAPSSGGLVPGVLVPVMVNGCLVLVPVDAETVAIHGVDGVTVESAEGSDTAEVDPVLRRDFSGAAAALTLSMVEGLDLARLRALFGPQPAGSRQLGVADVEVVEQITDTFVRQDYAHGGGLIREAAVAQLHATLPLLDAQVSPGLRPRLMVATARLACQAGWISFDVTRHNAARRIWTIGLNIARKAEHPLGDDLTVFLLYDMAFQAVHLGRPDDALRLVQAGHTPATGPQFVSASTASCLAYIQAKAHAAQGDAAACERALGAAVDQFTSIDPATRPPWGTFLDDTGLVALQGGAHYTLAAAECDALAAGRAVPLLRQAVDRLGPGYARPRAHHLVDLTGAHALAGDTDTAVTIGHQAIDAVTGLSSPRLHDKLDTLNTVLEPLQTSAGVAELRSRLAAATAA